MYVCDETSLDRWRAARLSNDATAVRTGDALREWADHMRALPVEAVTDKRPLRYSPSTDLHSFQSLATYYWPNPNTPDGLPFIERDGEPSPLLKEYDYPRWRRTADSLAVLTRAGAVLGDTEYSENAAQRLNRWFIDPATAMHPHLDNAQFAPGVNKGRGAGVIDFAIFLPGVFDQALFLRNHCSTIWDEASHHQLTQWAQDLFDWLRTSPIALEEDRAPNNHGIYFDALIAYVAVFIGERDFARERLASVIDHRIAEQMRLDGGMPHELHRTLSLTYTILTLSGLCTLARLGEHVDIDLWSATTHDGRGIRAGLGFLSRSLAAPGGWSHQQISPVPNNRLARLAVAAARGLGDATAREMFAKDWPDDDAQLALLVDASANPLIEIRRDVFPDGALPKAD